MSGEKNLNKLIDNLSPVLNHGVYVFASVKDINTISRTDTIGEFKEAEGSTVIIAKDKADELGLTYNYIASWITLKVHSALDAVGLTALFSNALAKHNISCNVIAGYYHDHIFVDTIDSERALEILNNLAKGVNN